MTKPKNPYECNSDVVRDAWGEGYATGLRDGEKRLARALRRLIKRLCSSTVLPIVNWEEILLDWLTTHQKKERK